MESYLEALSPKTKEERLRRNVSVALWLLSLVLIIAGWEYQKTIPGAAGSFLATVIHGLAYLWCPFLFIGIHYVVKRFIDRRKHKL